LTIKTHKEEGIVDINSIRNYYTRNNVNSVYSKDVNVKSAEVQAKATNTDIVDFGAKGTEKTTYEKAVMNYKVAYNKPADSERIKELKEKYHGDACPISSSEIAGAIMSNVIGFSR
jgi:hypothetical protein